MNTKKVILALFSLMMSLSMSAQILTPATWNYELSKKDIKLGDTVELIFKVKLDDTWHLYSHIQNYEIGPKKAEFEFDPNDSYTLIGDLEAVGSVKHYDDIFEVDVNYFEETAEFRQKVKILKANATVTGYYEYQVCTTVDGKCILGDDDFEFKINTIH